MQIFRKLLWPFSLIYGFITYLRNKSYDFGISQTYIIPKKSICVGNLSTGGTGKTPHVAYLAEYLSSKIETTLLSRGYGRKTSGFIIVTEKSTAEDVGDEPLFYSTHFKNALHVAVCENRKEGVNQINTLFPSNKLIILDDAFQHRAVKAGFSILLTEFKAPFFNDLVLPAGNLREWQSGKHRADCIIVTKCPAQLTEDQKQSFSLKLGFERKKVFFSSIEYGEIVPFSNQKEQPKNILLVTGIANPSPFVDWLKKEYTVEHLQYKDHHVFSREEIEQIHQKFDIFAGSNKIILTTEKDFMRLKDYKEEFNLNAYPWYYQPISVKIDEEIKFKEIIDQYVNTI
jgi:tetraacyldisaccharide 4'-kinase